MELEAQRLRFCFCDMHPLLKVVVAMLARPHSFGDGLHEPAFASDAKFPTDHKPVCERKNGSVSIDDSSHMMTL